MDLQKLCVSYVLKKFFIRMLILKITVAGAKAISVLSHQSWFDGSLETFKEVHETVNTASTYEQIPWLLPPLPQGIALLPPLILSHCDTAL